MIDKQEILALNAYGFGVVDTAPLGIGVDQLLQRRQQSFGATSVLFYQRPLHIVSASGCSIFAADGTRYLDLYNNVLSVGHCHPEVTKAICSQVQKLNINSRYLFEVVHDYAEKLLSLFPSELSNVVLTCTGSESNDLALRILRCVTGGYGLVVTSNAYHGNTTAVTEVSPSSYRQGSLPAHVRTVPPPDPMYYGTDVGRGFAIAVASQIDHLRKAGIPFAGLLVDTIFSSDGVYPDPPGLLQEAVSVVHEAGGLWIADEVQPGFGRTGVMWGFQRHEVVPDLVTLGKPMGNGFPLSGIVTRPQYLQQFSEQFGYFNTFAGNPVAAAAGLAVLRVIEEEQLMDHAGELGTILRSQVQELSTHCPVIGGVRGTGLYLGVDIVDPETHQADSGRATRVINGLCEKRQILVGAAGSFGNTLKIRPPLCLQPSEGEEFIEALEEVCQAALY
ncbi:MAG: aspartate aminotransferase family protein [Synechococcaceae cyanobacterium SM2_3_1]|nr:aspartate aminotransferase family protein [Synechococcaceae cyanobacterium SM2_3_1]